MAATNVQAFPGDVTITDGLAVSKDIESTNSFITERVLFKETWPNGHNSLAGDLGTWVITNLSQQSNPSSTTTPDGYTLVSFVGDTSANGEFTSPAFDLSNYAIVDGTLQAEDKRKTTTRVFMKFWLGSRQFDASGEVVQVQFSPDNGSTWYTVATSQDRTNTDRFTMVSADLSPYILDTSTQAKIRFYMPWTVGSGDYMRVGRIWIHESDVPTNLGGMWLGAAGKIGIGKTNPVYPLDVNGTFSYSGTTYNSGILGGGAHPVKDQIINSGTLSAGSWYRIAKNGTAVQGGTSGNRCMARFTITDVQTSEHSTRIFYAGSTFGRDPFFHLVANTSYDPPGVIEKVRIVDSEGADGEGCAIDIYIHATVGSNAVQVVMDDNIQESGFALVNYEANPNTTGMLVAEYDLGDITWGVSPADNGADSGIFMAQTGRVGIGTQTPAVPLHVFGDAAESSAPFRIQSADNYAGMIMVDTGGGVQLSSDSGTLRFITDYAADLTGGHEVARLTENELKIKATRSSRIYIEDTGSDNGTYYQGVYIGSPNGDTNAGMRMVVTHDANTSSNQRNIIGFTNRDLEFSSFSDNSSLGGAGTLEMSISQSNNQVYIPNHLATAAPANIAATFNCGASSFIRLIGGGGTSGNAWNTTAVNMHYPNGGGGTTLFVVNGNQSSGDATYSCLYMLRKAYTGTDWTSNSSRVVKLGGLANGSLSSSLEFREISSKLQFRTTNAGNLHYYAIDFD